MFSSINFLLFTIVNDFHSFKFFLSNISSFCSFCFFKIFLPKLDHHFLKLSNPKFIPSQRLCAIGFILTRINCIENKLNWSCPNVNDFYSLHINVYNSVIAYTVTELLSPNYWEFGVVGFEPLI